MTTSLGSSVHSLLTYEVQPACTVQLDLWVYVP
jgi:hypothetical protein